MAKDIFDIIIEKEFDQLNTQELTEISEFCANEQEFVAMKQVLLHSKTVADGPKLSPKEATKEKLDNLFDSTYGKSRKFIPFYLNPLIQIAAVVAIGFAVWMFLPSTENITSDQLAQNTPQKDDEKIEIESKVTSISSEDTSFKTEKSTLPEPLPHISDDGMVPEYTPTYRKWEMESEKEIQSPFIEETATSNNNTMKKSKDELAESMNNDLNDKKMEDSKSRSFQTFSSPSISVSDISVNPDKKPVQQSLTTMNVSEQKNVLNYLVAKY